jgi:phosphinothricin acetyltransferase
LTVRPATHADLADLTQIYNHYVETSHATFDTQPFEVGARAAWLEQFDGVRYQCWVADNHGTGTNIADIGTGTISADIGTGTNSGTNSGTGTNTTTDLGTGITGYATSQQLKPKSAYETSVEVSVYIAPGWARQGIGRGLYESLFGNLVGQDLHRAYAIIALPNDASVALHQDFGFRDVARLSEVGRKFDRYWDVIWMERAL